MEEICKNVGVNMASKCRSDEADGPVFRYSFTDFDWAASYRRFACLSVSSNHEGE